MTRSNGMRTPKSGERQGKAGWRRGEGKVYSLYRRRPVPESHVGAWERRSWLRSARRQRLAERTRAIERRERTKPHNSEYDRFHLATYYDSSRVDQLHWHENGLNWQGKPNNFL